MTSLSISSSLKLNDGMSIPLLGLGASPSSACTKACLSAFDEGYRQVDTAQLYGTEEAVGQALKSTTVPRSSIYIISKVWDGQHTREAAHQAVIDSLATLQLEYIDLYLIHNPRSGPVGRHQAWLGLQDAQKEGKVKSIGVSNFTPAHIAALVKSEGVFVKPAINQVEFHPWNQQKEIGAYCKREGIAVQAYTPLTMGKNLGDPVIVKIAKKHGKTAAQVVLRWVLQQDIVAIPKSQNPSRIKENAGLYDFELGEEDCKEIAKLDAGREGNTGDWDPWLYE